ncbi:MAG: response regulator transcription factor [Rhodanobacteraceae bacterium]
MNTADPHARIRVVAVDDHPLLLDGIASALADEPDIEIVALAADGESGIEAFRRHQPDVVLMDLQMPGVGGLEALRIIRAEYPDARVVVLTTYRGDAQVRNALESGASGFLLKTMLRKELRETIRAAHAGRRVIPPEIAMELAEHVNSGSLTTRETEVLGCVARGDANRDVALRLRITEDTVKAHMKSILAKLDAKDRTNAVLIALRRGILEV